jgi:hypothetical protein
LTDPEIYGSTGNASKTLVSLLKHTLAWVCFAVLNTSNGSMLSVFLESNKQAHNITTRI